MLIDKRQRYYRAQIRDAISTQVIAKVSLRNEQRTKRYELCCASRKYFAQPHEHCNTVRCAGKVRGMCWLCRSATEHFIIGVAQCGL